MPEIKRTCTQLIAAPSGFVLCGKPIESSEVTAPNLVCDRFVFIECPDGHTSMIPIIDESSEDYLWVHKKIEVTDTGIASGEGERRPCNNLEFVRLKREFSTYQKDLSCRLGVHRIGEWTDTGFRRQ